MSYPLRRDEIVDVTALRAMLEASPGKAAQAILAAAGQGTQASASPLLLPHGLDVMRWLLSADPELAAPVSGRRWTRDA